MTTLSIRHRTVYTYRRPVTFGEHRLMIRPRDSHDLRHISSRLLTSPPASVSWRHDVFGNSIAIATFDAAATELVLESNVVVELFGLTGLHVPIAPFARHLPFAYPFEEQPDLRHSIERHYRDPDHLLDTWVRRFMDENPSGDTWDVLAAITSTIQREFVYAARVEEGVQTPIETLRRGNGSCRDFALLMMEAARCLGMAARFVTGYLYDPQRSESGDALRGADATHGWTQVYLPGAGWVDFDPTNGLTGGEYLIRVGVARDPAQAVPIDGTYYGAAEDFNSMAVEVAVERVAGSD